MTVYRCVDDERRARLLEQATGSADIPPLAPADIINGIDFLEVEDDAGDPLPDRQRTLHVHFLSDIAPGTLTASNLRVEGGERIRSVTVLPATIAVAGRVLTFEVDRAGDFSRYTFRIVTSPDDPTPPVGYDPVRSALDFTFKAGCPTDFDCRETVACAPVASAGAPTLDYRARDYAELRRLMLDRMAELAPEWTERNPSDMGVMLVELLAYVGDQLSYRQDAVATEAYLRTARSRISVRRHARLVDYKVHDGSNARTWVQFSTNTDGVVVAAGRSLLTHIVGAAPRLDALPDHLEDPGAATVFETLDAITLVQAHDTMPFYTWGGRACCLQRGATRATLRGAFAALRRGDWLVLAEARGPRTGATEDADPERRHVVRLTSDPIVRVDPIGGRFDSPPTADAVTVTEIEWSAADALPFTLWITSVADEEHLGVLVRDVSQVHGNVVPADHGRPVVDEILDAVPEGTRRPGGRTECCSVEDDDIVPPRYRPRLLQPALTRRPVLDFARPPLPAPMLSARDVSHAAAHDTNALIVLESIEEVPEMWHALDDLLASGADEPSFVVETESDGTAFLRFGDDDHGRRPASGTRFSASYRTGNGRRGNVGRGAIRHVVTTDGRVTGASNLLPGTGGTDPETIEEIRQRAPVAFRHREAAVTPDDYARFAERHDDVQRAAATFRWTGSWRTVFVTIDRRGGRPVDAAFEASVRRHLERYRLAGHDLEIDAPHFVSLELALDVCVERGRAAADVRRTLLELFGNGVLADGRQALFHPDQLSFGGTVFLSPLYAAAQRTPGVRSTSIRLFRRQGDALSSGLSAGRLEFGRLEIPRLDNTPDFPERGIISINVAGGR